MNEQRRNLAVGLMVLISLGLLATMVVRFAGMPDLFQRGYLLKIQMDASYDVHEGDPILLKGLSIGRISEVHFTDNDPNRGVTMTARIDSDVNVPSNVICQVYGGAIKNGWIALSPIGPFPIDPATGKEIKFLSKDQVATIRGEFKGIGLIPDELIDAVKSLKRLSDSVSNLLGAPSEGAPAAPSTSVATTSTAPAGPAGIPGTLAKLDRALDGMNAVLGDPQNQANIKTSLDGLAKASASAVELMKDLKQVAGNADKFLVSAQGVTTRASDDLHGLTQKLMTDAEHISQLLTALGKATDKLNTSEGTLGKLLNDPELYNGLVETTKGLDKLMKDFDALVKQWKEKGINLKM